jgi:manganese-dependent inorganic pyrophosphatase
MKPIYIIGHKNPDVDSIAAAISYKVFKQSTDEGLYVAASAGEMNDEARYVLEQLEFEEPLILRNVSTRVEDLLDEEDDVYCMANMSMTEIGNLMRQNNLKTVPVLDEEKKFLGLLTIGDLAMIFLDKLGTGRHLEDSPRILQEILDLKVSNIMKTHDLVLFEKDETAEEARKHMISTRFRNYPVVDESNHYLGMISRYNLLEMKRKQLILVDHNEKKQAVDGVEEAEIREIIDHHRVGDLQTISPIYFHNEPVGSTCTLIAQKYLDKGVYCGKNLAALMMAGILSDTMLFKSPTTTGKDRQIAGRLQEISGFEPLVWGRRILENTEYLESLDDQELIAMDLKEYTAMNIVFAVAQVETVDMKRMLDRKNLLIQSMHEICTQSQYALLSLMVTDIMEERTEMILVGELSSVAEMAFGQTAVNHSIILPGVMSRKKQVVPVIYEALRKQSIM